MHPTCSRRIQSRHLAFLFVVVSVITAGCAEKPQLMPTPNVYADGIRDPLPDVPEVYQTNTVDVLYLTDRKPEKDSTRDHMKYGFERSRSLAMGISTVQIGENVSWDELVKASKTSKRQTKLPLSLVKTTELVRFPATPKTLVEIPSAPEREAHPSTTPTALEVTIEDDKHIGRQELQRRLALSPRKDVYVFIHGYNNTFEDAVETIGQLWHFLGRQGVPIAYSWPAGHGGLLRGYTYDRESSEFTVYHLKEVLRAIASIPEVQNVHIIAHSRGTDVASTALRELHLEYIGANKNTREQLKLATLVLAAPDMDVDVVMQRLVTARLGRVPGHFALYVCAKDEALGISNWLFSGAARLGKLHPDIFTPEELEAMRKIKTAQIIDARITDPGPYGHSYFHANPAVSSDLMLLIRYGLSPGPERPLELDPHGFWYLEDNYPQPTTKKSKTSSGSNAGSDWYPN